MKKEIIIPIYLIGLSLVFVIVSLLLFLTGGKNTKLLSRKLKIGALIITMTAILGCGGSNSQQAMVTCYKPAPPDFFSITDENRKDGVIVVDEETNYILNCILDRRTSEEYSFKLVDSEDKTITKGDLEAEDGAFDEDSEDVKVKFDKDIEKGDFQIKFFTCSKDKIEDQEPFPTSLYNVRIK
ncbi:MAG: hypothetical protein PHV06_03980 [bacterium]|nr:hypothetical protein [bacterium]